ncbi:105R [Cherax quadricarinatus iridovirus]|uniref:Uncharacterized protein n=1 Tax=Shrimp hemocyte iridescent virus TaxID=2039780 RepID=A0A291B0N5_9VIRU|nr:head decoration [Cherax quadricarinatus iridovirus]YP_010084801.1 head decoration [Shrimp hemocyte iridescent virus]UPA43415.1 hypothetical protein 4TH000141 [Iridovirus CN01]ASZ85085.1 105R [Cherax quadricarinatus iridovirus]ATE87058.1 hypothetical protein [Shrimp hemocyte iridescent virus]UPA43491.1 hypothetical protein 3TG000058 [Iridovirus CN01]UPA43687.1 hypothetical protein 1DG000095 [Iridovirus CN01]
MTENFKINTHNLCRYKKCCKNNKNVLNSPTIFTSSLKIDGSVKPTEDIDWNDNKITNVAEPTEPTDIVTKKYTDEKVESFPKPKRIVYDNFFQGGNSREIDTTQYPDWTHIFVTVKINLQTIFCVIHRNWVGVEFTFNIYGDGIPQNMVSNL